MSNRTKHGAADVIKAIEGSGGIKMLIAQRLSVTRITFDRYLKRWPTVMEAFKAEREGLIDIAESVVRRNIQLAHQAQAGGVIVDSGDSKWLLSRLGKDRGYGDKQELDVTSGGEPIRVVVGGIDLDNGV